MLMEDKFGLLKIRPGRRCQLDMGTGGHRKIFPAFRKNLLFQVRVAGLHQFFVAVGHIVQRRTRGQNHQMARLDEMEMFRAQPGAQRRIEGRIVDHLPVFISESRQRGGDFAKSRPIPNLGQIGTLSRTNRHRIRKAMILHELLPYNRVEANGFRSQLKAQPEPGRNLETKFAFGGKNFRRLINSPRFALGCQPWVQDGGYFCSLNLKCYKC